MSLRQKSTQSRTSQEVRLIEYGLQRSGNNFLETLMTRQFSVRFLNSNADRRAPEQRHFRLYDDKDIVGDPQYRNDIVVRDIEDLERVLPEVPDYYVIISKDPYSWLLSYQSWGRRHDWPNVSHHYIEEYNLFYGKWLALSEQTDRIAFVRYIDLLKKPEETLAGFEARFALRKKRVVPLLSGIVRKVPQSGKFSRKRRRYYLNQEYLSEYNETTLQEVNQLADHEVLSQLGYQLVTRIPEAMDT